MVQVGGDEGGIQQGGQRSAVGEPFQLLAFLAPGAAKATIMDAADSSANPARASPTSGSSQSNSSQRACYTRNLVIEVIDNPKFVCDLILFESQLRPIGRPGSELELRKFSLLQLQHRGNDL